MGLSGKCSQLSIREGYWVKPSVTEHCASYSWGFNTAKKEFSNIGGLCLAGFPCGAISLAKELNFNAGDFSSYQNRMKLNNTGASWRACLRSPTCIPPQQGVLLGWSDRAPAAKPFREELDHTNPAPAPHRSRLKKSWCAIRQKWKCRVFQKGPWVLLSEFKVVASLPGQIFFSECSWVKISLEFNLSQQPSPEINRKPSFLDVFM